MAWRTLQQGTARWQTGQRALLRFDLCLPWAPSMMGAQQPSRAALKTTALFPFLLFLIALGGAGAVPAAARLEVEIKGVKDELLENVRAYLGIYREREREDLDEGRIRRLHRRAKGEIAAALQPFGYYRPRVDSSLEPVQNGWRAVYVIDPGKRIPVTRVDIEITGPGAEEAELREAAERFPMRAGDPLDHRQYEEGKRRLLHRARSNGYRDARYTEHRLRVDLDTYEAGILLRLDTGEHYVFGPVSIEDVGIDRELLRRYLVFEPGDPYDNEHLLESQRALEESGYFSSVEVQPVETETGRRIPVEVRLKLRKPNRYSLGVGYGTDTGIRGRLGWERRYIGHRGHRLNLNLKVSQIRQEFYSAYQIPVRNPRTDMVELTAGLRDRSTSTSDSVLRAVGVAQRVRWGRWREALFLRAESDTFKVGSDSGTTGMLVMGGTLTRLVADDPRFTRRGRVFSLELTGSAEELGSDLALLRAVAYTKWVVPAGGDGRLLLRGRLGTLAVSDFHALPPRYRFFTGGDQTIRGFEYESIGARDDAGQVIGGRNLLEAGVEYDHRIKGNWRAAVFYDAGNAFGEEPLPLREGAGVGLRLQLPIGMVRVDLASAISEPKRPLRLHITIGPDL